MYYNNLKSTFLILCLFCSFHQYTLAQDVGVFSGALEMNNNFFIEDKDIGATDIIQYENQLIGTDAWFNLQYQYKGYEVGIRYDLYNNSNLRNPSNSFNGQGIGRWYARKKIHNLDIQAGYIYDQIGSGIIYRSYEARPLFIDNALQGIRLAYDINDNWVATAFGGKQKFSFDTHGANIKGLSLEGYIDFGEGKAKMAPGFGVVNRTLTEESIDGLIDIATGYFNDADKSQVELKHNNYAASLFNRLTVGAFSWYVEGAVKSDEAIFDPNETYLNFNGDQIKGQFVNHNGSVLYSSLTYAKSGLGITLEGKRTEYFDLRTDPRLAQVNGIMNFIPPMNRENTYRLTARYAPAVQLLGEIALQADVKYRINKKWSAAVNFSNITDLDNELLYREVYADFLFKKSRKWQLAGGLQIIEYNQDIYEEKPGVDNVQAVTPFAEFLYKITRKKSLRIEAQYMSTDQDFGSWAYVLAEYGIAPHWIFTVTDMYNLDPKKEINGELKKLHYPTAGIIYSHKSNRFGLSYVKQVEGIVCTGGVCRLEPAFSGVKFTVNSTF